MRIPLRMLAHWRRGISDSVVGWGYRGNSACARLTTKSRVIESAEGAPQRPVDISGSDHGASQWPLPDDGAATVNRKMKLVLPA